MQTQKCIVCGQAYSTGLNVMGCLICFPCEKKLLRPCAALAMPRRRRRALARWYFLTKDAPPRAAGGTQMQ